MAATVAGIGFFVLAGVGLLSGLPAHTCAIRAVGGAAALYVMTVLVARLVLRIVVDIVVSGRPGQAESKDTSGESGNE